MRDRWGVAAVAVSSVAFGMAYSLLRLPVAHHVSAWTTPADIWGTFRAAQMIGWGGAGVLYSHTAFVTFPGIAVLLAPVALVAGALHLTASFPYPLAHPSAWLLLGPVEMAAGNFVLFPLDTCARRLGVDRRRRVVLTLVAAALVWPVTAMWGHPEDLFALAFGLYGLLDVYDGRWTRGAAFFAVALAVQPLVVLLVPIAAAYVPVRRWLHAATITALPSALLLAVPLTYTWRTTTRNIVDQPNYPTLHTLHPTPWLALAPRLARAHTAAAGHFSSTAHGLRFGYAPTHVSAVVAAGPERVLAVVGAVAIGVLVARRQPSLGALLWLGSLALGLRCVFESVIDPYYLVPALVLALVVAAGAGWRRLALVAACIGGCSYLSYLDAGVWAYYVPVIGAMLVAWAAAWPRRSLGSPAVPDTVTDDTVASVSRETLATI